MSQAWDKYKQMLSSSGFTPEEEKALHMEYQEYRMNWYYDQPALSFDAWWRSMADEAKDRAKV